MKTIQLQLNFSDNLELKSSTFLFNDTGIESNKDLLRSIGIVLTDSIELDEMINNAKKIING